ncbi:hypothetical protein [Mesonia mobilis]|uniref:Transmembrane protein n=1 Tax=Mesonia mobilis TaxID=369791 RepID=A0ABQ3BXM0_9FLAO|nr:hypothetical protein [Mesonia mobilis]MBQ0738897.1 hypothetical protein [Aquimarina celericrescens]GGZ60850.1 hypothetical protein GCM10008088_23080 [Mesonia mobilis]
MVNHIEEEVEQFKIAKIAETELKLEQFQNAYQEINENIAIKISKNATFNLFRVVFILLSLFLFALGVYCFFPGEFILLMEENGESFNSEEKNIIVLVFKALRYVFFSTAVVLYFVSYLLKLNNRKRNTIYSLSHLLEEMISFLDKSSKDEKIKYEQYLDYLAENRRSSSAK